MMSNCLPTTTDSGSGLFFSTALLPECTGSPHYTLPVKPPLERQAVRPPHCKGLKVRRRARSAMCSVADSIGERYPEGHRPVPPLQAVGAVSSDVSGATGGSSDFCGLELAALGDRRWIDVACSRIALRNDRADLSSPFWSWRALSQTSRRSWRRIASISRSSASSFILSTCAASSLCARLSG